MKDMHAEGIAHVVGLEHIDPEDIHLRRAASIEDSTTFTKKFRKGDILFGRRRAYLKKAAQVNFDGICSGDITVMRAKEGLLPKLLPFVVNNDKFFDYAVKHSAGGLSPRVKFHDLANYEFLLPPKEQQAQLAELLWAMDEVIENIIFVKEKTEFLRLINREKLFTYGIAALDNAKNIKLKNSKCGLINKEWQAHKFFNIAEVTSGQVDPKDEKYSGLVQIGSERIEPNTGRITEFKTAKELNITSGNYLFSKEHIIYSKIRPYFKKVANPNFTGLCSADIYPIKPNSDLLCKEYLFYYLLTDKFTQKLLRFQNRTGMPKVNREELGSMYIPVPSLDEQKGIVNILKHIDDSLDAIEKKLSSSKALQKSLINQIF
ncbi:restriction endonuclease subunit S [Catalinimonas alkaloidigena]|uniref:restriction endonuclease subunit S n=1 Tax=Catalinimonas alkaloidigena TaxID=1075417 RepID=UPI0024053B41|nr:restriction endonuclease subunit S [Catalinimonas alkaloidigena]